MVRILNYRYCALGLFGPISTGCDLPSSTGESAVEFVIEREGRRKKKHNCVNATLDHGAFHEDRAQGFTVVN